MNPLDLIKNALAQLTGGQKPLSPLPQDGYSAAQDEAIKRYRQRSDYKATDKQIVDLYNKFGDKMFAYDDPTTQAIKKYRQLAPNTNISDDQVAGLYSKYGDKMFGNQATPTPTQSVLGAAIQGAQGLLGGRAQAMEPSPTPTIVPGFENRNPEVQAAIRAAFHNVAGKDLSNEAINIAAGESGLNPQTIHQNKDYIPELGGPSTDYGPFQINNYWQRKNLEKYGYKIDDMLDPKKAADFASKLVAAQGGKFGKTWYANQKFGYE